MSKPKWLSNPLQLWPIVLVVVGGIAAYAKSEVKTEQIRDDVIDLQATVQAQDKELREYDKQQGLIQQDVSYIKDGMKVLLDRKR